MGVLAISPAPGERILAVRAPGESGTPLDRACLNIYAGPQHLGFRVRTGWGPIRPVKGLRAHKVADLGKRTSENTPSRHLGEYASYVSSGPLVAAK